jgi:hypothetical protein
LGLDAEGRRKFFFEKKNQKTSVCCGGRLPQARTKGDKSFGNNILDSVDR